MIVRAVQVGSNDRVRPGVVAVSNSSQTKKSHCERGPKEKNFPRGFFTSASLRELEKGRQRQSKDMVLLFQHETLRKIWGRSYTLRIIFKILAVEYGKLDQTS